MNKPISERDQFNMRQADAILLHQGLSVSPEARADGEAVARGEMTVEQAIQRVISRDSAIFEALKNDSHSSST